jgi:hypothetical protein
MEVVGFFWSVGGGQCLQIYIVSLINTQPKLPPKYQSGINPPYSGAQNSLIVQASFYLSLISA